MVSDERLEQVETRSIVDFLALSVNELGSATTIDALGKALATIVKRLVMPDLFSIYFVEPDTGELIAPYVHGFTEEERIESIRTAKDRHPGYVIRTGEILNIPDVEADTQKRTQDSRRSMKVASRLWMPIAHDGRISGTIGFASQHKYAFSDFHVAVMKFACQMAAVSYENIVNHTRLLLKVEVIERQKEELRRLASPMMEVWSGILAVPLIGTMDAERFTIVAEKLLPAIIGKRVETVIVDLTGIDAMDADTVHQLGRLRSAVELLGCQCIISGIRYETAKQMIDQAGDIKVGSTVRSLAQALDLALRKTRRGRA